MQEFKNVKLGPLIIRLVFEQELILLMGDFFDKYVVQEKPEMIIKFMTDATLQSPEMDEFYSKTHLRTEVTNKYISTKSSFCNATYNLISREGTATFPKADQIVWHGILLYIQIIVGYTLIKHNCLLIHASGINNNGKGHLFVGKSGVGKTTLAKKAIEKGIKPLGDDCVGVDVKNKKLFTTFFRENYDMQEVKIHSCSFLMQGQKLELQEMSFKDSLYELVSNNHASLYLGKASRKIIITIIRLSKEIINSFPPKILETNLEDDIKVICDVLEKK